VLYQLSYAHRALVETGVGSLCLVADLFPFLPLFCLSLCLFWARPAGVEPAARGLEGRCSIQLSYGRMLMISLG
jgi:hypothetical protein